MKGKNKTTWNCFVGVEETGTMSDLGQLPTYWWLMTGRYLFRKLRGPREVEGTLDTVKRHYPSSSQNSKN